MGPTQCKLGRMAAGLGVRELAELAEVSANTISRLERGEELKASTLATVRAALEGRGVIFIDPDEEAGPGVRLRDKAAR